MVNGFWPTHFHYSSLLHINLNPLQHLLYLLPTGTVAGTKSRNSARTNSFCGWSQWRQVLWPGPFLRIASWVGWKVRLLDIQLGQDSAEETLKLVERVAQHSPEQSWLEFGEEKMVRSWNRWTLKLKTLLDDELTCRGCVYYFQWWWGWIWEWWCKSFLTKQTVLWDKSILCTYISVWACPQIKS